MTPNAVPRTPEGMVRLPFLRSSGRRPVRSSARRAIRSMGVVTALLCLAGYVQAYAHMVLVRHATCVEHAEVFHPGADNHHVAGPTALENQKSRVEAASNAPHADDHCLVVTVRDRKAAILSAPVDTWFRSPDPIVVPPVPTAQRWVAPQALIRLAPKTSPPVVIA